MHRTCASQWPASSTATPERLLEWSHAAGVLRDNEAVAAPSSARAGQRLLHEIAMLRDALHALFSARIAAVAAPPDALRQLGRRVHAAWRNRALQHTADAGPAWRTIALTPRMPLERVALSALQELTMVPCERLKRCGWLFRDATRGGSRRWCAMETCGSIDKMRRYRGRLGRATRAIEPARHQSPGSVSMKPAAAIPPKCKDPA